MDWFENDRLFRQELETGHRHAELVAERLRAALLEVEVTPVAWRETIEDRVDFADEHDLTVGRRNPCIVEIKSRDLGFTGPSDYPYGTALVDTVKGWHAMTRKPVAIVLISQQTGGLAVIGRSSESEWIETRRFDHKRRISERFYVVDKALLKSFAEFVEYLRERERSSS